MNAENVWYLDSSAIVKLIAREPESTALRSFLRPSSVLITSALARTEVNRAVMGLGQRFHRQAAAIFTRLDLMRVSSRVLDDAGRLEASSIRSLDAIHLASARLLGSSLSGLVTYDRRMAHAADAFGWPVHSPL